MQQNQFTYQRNYTLSSRHNDVYLYVDEIIDVLKVKNVQQRKLYLSMLIHSKKHKQLGTSDFYMAYSTMENYGNTGNRKRLRLQINELEKQGRVKVVSHHRIDEVRSSIEGRLFDKPNVYRIKKDFKKNSGEKVFLKATDVENVDINDILAKAIKENLISFADCRKHLSRRNLNALRQAL
mgnify:CR=1 FL=1